MSEPRVPRCTRQNGSTGAESELRLAPIALFEVEGGTCVESDIAFASATIKVQAELLKKTYEIERRGRGSAVFGAFRHVFEEIVRNAAQVQSSVEDTADLGPQRLLRQQLQSLAGQLKEHHGFINKYSRDVGRRDLPMGMLYLIDRIARQVLPGNTDQLVHVDSSDDYSSTAVGPGVIVNLPAQTADNVLLAPVIAHEIAHSLFDAEVRRQFLTLTESGLRTALAQMQAEDAAGVTAGGSRVHLLRSWNEEFFCDAVATLISGPSFLLALVSQVSATPWSAEGFHPPNSMRIKRCLAILGALGWGDYLDSKVPAVASWIADLGTEALLEPQDMFSANGETIEQVGNLADQMAPAVLDFAKAFVAVPFERAIVEEGVAFCVGYFDETILPVNHSEAPHDVWELVLSGWLVGMRTAGSGPASIAAVPFDRTLNSMLAKTVELSGIVHVWSKE